MSKMPLNSNRHKYASSKEQVEKESLLLQSILDMEKTLETAKELFAEDKEMQESINNILEVKNKLLNKKKGDIDNA